GNCVTEQTLRQYQLDIPAQLHTRTLIEISDFIETGLKNQWINVIQLALDRSTDASVRMIQTSFQLMNGV
ncbi:hypothetical protein Bhyg_03137, partial [Pseudolycoriella hygida]